MYRRSKKQPIVVLGRCTTVDYYYYGDDYDDMMCDAAFLVLTCKSNKIVAVQ